MNDERDPPQSEFKWENVYENGVCPDCELKIPKHAMPYDRCKNCGHVFWDAP